MRDTVDRGEVSILVPYRPDGGHRDRIWEAVHERLVTGLQGQGINPEILVEDDGVGVPDMFNHPAAINRAARKAQGNLFAIVDADVTVLDFQGLGDALKSSLDDRCWRLPQTYITLTEETTMERLSTGDLGARVTEREMEWVGNGVSWSGIVIVPPEAFWQVNGSDERYEGWGADDVALGLALDALYDSHIRYPGSVVHLWHERGVQEQGLHRNGDVQRALTERYVAAAQDPKAMAPIVAEKRPLRSLHGIPESVEDFEAWGPVA